MSIEISGGDALTRRFVATLLSENIDAKHLKIRLDEFKEALGQLKIRDFLESNNYSALEQYLQETVAEISRSIDWTHQNFSVNNMLANKISEHAKKKPLAFDALWYRDNRNLQELYANWLANLEIHFEDSVKPRLEQIKAIKTTIRYMNEFGVKSDKLGEGVKMVESKHKELVSELRNLLWGTALNLTEMDRRVCQNCGAPLPREDINLGEEVEEE
ncbi:hypothetical protein MUP77_09390 [Candidatus Bathyarchaeota archaeon]|nr:hypothetical protein [Candidatus Bathyarchaeota archaeon]